MADSDSTRAASKQPGVTKPSPRWWAPVMSTLLIVGLLWIVIYYLTGGQYPIESIGRWNMGVGFGIIMAGFGMAAFWR